MGYRLGIDLGTTYTAAATVDDAGRAEIFQLGDRSAVVPTVVLLREDGEVLVGDAAVRRAVSEPQRVAREFKRRLGDTTPYFLGGAPHSAESLMARVLGWALERVTERHGAAPDRVALTRPANWGSYKVDLFKQAARMAEVTDPLLVTEPEAAAVHYGTVERVAEGEIVAVYDLGGGTFDATVLRRTAGGFEILGAPEGIERLGGIDVDAAVLAHVQRSLGGALDALDEDDPATLAALARLRTECQDAKEALSSDTDAVIPVLVPNVSTEVRITRDELEQMVRPALADSVAALRRALRGAGVAPEEVGRVLLVGGSSRIPLVAQLVTAELGRPVAVDAHPKHAVALGAALAAAGTPATTATDVTRAVPTITPEMLAGGGAAGTTIVAANGDVLSSPGRGAMPTPSPTEPDLDTSADGATPPPTAPGETPPPDAAAASGAGHPTPGTSGQPAAHPTGDPTGTASTPDPDGTAAPPAAPTGNPGPDANTPSPGDTTATSAGDHTPGPAHPATPHPTGEPTATASTPASGGAANAPADPSGSGALPDVPASVAAAADPPPAVPAPGTADVGSPTSVDEAITADERSRAPLLAVLVVVVAALAAASVLAVLALTGDDDGEVSADEATSTDGPSVDDPSAPPTTTGDDPVTSLPDAGGELPPACTGATGNFICITDAEWRGDTLVVTYQTELDLSLAPSPEALPEDSNHAHFFFDSVPLAQAGVPGAGPWTIWDEQPTFDAFTRADVPEGATAVCVLVANFDHSVQSDTGNCIPLPE